jgi:hypothetical protein
MKTLNLISLIVLQFALLFAVSCREEIEDLQLPSSDEAIEIGSELETLLIRAALLDGSDDNVLDNSSCYRIELPVDVRVFGVSRSLSTQQDVLELEEVFENSLRRRDAIELVYPFSVTSSTYEVIRVQNVQELNQLSEGCQESRQDDDIECVDVVYPVTFSTYDQINQLTSQISISNDEELFRLLSDRRSNDTLISFNFPVRLNYDDGSTVSLSSNAGILSRLRLAEDGCEEADEPFYPDSPYKTLAPVSIKITEAPFPKGLVEHVWMTISEIQLKTEEDSDTTEFFTYQTNGQEIDVASLTNGLTEMLVDQDIPAGIYEFMNLQIASGRVVLTDGQEFDLDVPSGRIKVQKDGGIDLTSLLEETLLLDIDLSRSLVFQGNPNTPAGIRGVIFKPVIKLSDSNETGDISGSVTDGEDNSPIADAQITVLAADTINTTSFSNSEGNFVILGLLPGEYTLIIEKEEYNPVTLEDIEVDQGATTDLNVNINKQ